MIGYRFARRSFLAGVGGAVGLKVLLRNLESSAQGLAPPPRLLIAFWPLGTIKYFFLPASDSTSALAGSRILKPIADAGLADDTTVLYGLQTTSLRVPGGGAEAGTVKVMTGASGPGTRANGGEADDAAAGGPSFDQVFLRRVPELQRPGNGYCNVICDARVDSFETSAQCLSYSYTQRSIQAASGGTIIENVPLLPILPPTMAYAQLFGGFSGTPVDSARIRNLLRARRSVLDHSLRELARLRTLAPASESMRIDQHAEVIRKIESQLAMQIGGASDACQLPGAPDPALVGKSGSHFDYTSQPMSVPADDAIHAQVGQLHAAILRAAFQCDLIRVATFQWAPGTSHVSFGGMYPPDPGGAYMHNPMAHRLVNGMDTLTAYPPETRPIERGAADFLANVHTWYNGQTAQIVNGFKSATDVFGGNLLDSTIIPFVTERAEATSHWSPLPALIFGGRRLGMVHGQFLNLGAPRPVNDLWMTIAQAYLRTSDPLSALAGEAFDPTNVAPIPGLWRPAP